MTTPNTPLDDRPAQSVEYRPYAAETQPQVIKKGPGWGTYLVTILALLVIAAVVVFVLQNTQPINIKFFSWRQHFSKSSTALGAAAVAGLIAGLFLGLLPWMSARRKLKAARRMN